MKYNLIKIGSFLLWPFVAAALLAITGLFFFIAWIVIPFTTVKETSNGEYEFDFPGKKKPWKP